MSFAGSSLGKSLQSIRLVGYILFVLSVIDTIATFIPPAFTNPNWEFQVTGRLVDAVAVPLIALVMIFFAEQSDRAKIEKKILRILSWTCLGLGIIHFALLPLGLANTWRVNNRNNVQVGASLSQQLTVLQNTEAKLNQTNSEAELQKIIKELVQANPNQTPATVEPKVVKERMLGEITSTKQRLQASADMTKLTAFQNLVKASVKLNIGTLAAAIAYFYLWKFTAWARVSVKGKTRNKSRSSRSGRHKSVTSDLNDQSNHSDQSQFDQIEAIASQNSESDQSPTSDEK
jgi:hypothetical protein